MTKTKNEKRKDKNMNNKTHWTDNLQNDVRERLEACRTRRADIAPLTDVRWAAMKEQGMKEKGYTKEDALVFVLELLDCNSIHFDLTKEEYEDLIIDNTEVEQ